ncbi:hypothetical protein PG999_014390 [Apiospora kogelbergensis]|uniref:Uncharacterized protein n=1 Tax=Apiospora kogelbergensis TaxID=1337665 RepID=A0AAW0Q664_9PEZI
MTRNTTLQLLLGPTIQAPRPRAAGRRPGHQPVLRVGVLAAGLGVAAVPSRPQVCGTMAVF